MRVRSRSIGDDRIKFKLGNIFVSNEKTKNFKNILFQTEEKLLNQRIQSQDCCFIFRFEQQWFLSIFRWLDDLHRYEQKFKLINRVLTFRLKRDENWMNRLQCTRVGECSLCFCLSRFCWSNRCACFVIGVCMHCWRYHAVLLAG